MARRNILLHGEPALEKRSKPVTNFNKRLHTLLDDMRETLLDSGGVGLAAPQVGVLRRVALVIETNVEEEDDEYIIELINPEIVGSDGEQCGPEGCLSVPGVYGLVKRPETVRVKARDRDGNSFEVEGCGMTARAFCHELDHLDGVLFLSMAERILSPEELSSGEDAGEDADGDGGE